MGIAGWAIPREFHAQAATVGSHLERYSRVFNAVEINSSFYKPHRRSTYERWSGAVPTDFQFSAKIPKHITHELHLRGCDIELADFMQQIGGLGTRLGVLLVQLPPSLVYESRTAKSFFARLSASTDALIACEPRHPSWFESAADAALEILGIARVAADPEPVSGAFDPGGDHSFIYYRLHGSPRMYYSSYSPAYLAALDERLRAHAAAARTVWCIFDNTAEQAAWRNALSFNLL